MYRKNKLNQNIVSIPASILFVLGLFILFNIQGFGQKNNDLFKTKNLDKIPAGFPLSKIDFINISSWYGYRNHPVLNTIKLHKGIDLAAKKGAPVFATGSGSIETAAYHKGYGNYIIITHFSYLKTLYAHLWIRMVSTGDKVSKGQLIGFVGDTGLATGPHLHYEVELNNQKINPMLIWKNIINAK